MRIDAGRVCGLVAAAGLILAGVFMVGRLTVMDRPGADQVAHETQGSDYDAGFRAGLQAGQVQGRQEGRALQEGTTVSAGSRQIVRDAFNDGYAAGANDVFTGYDGGWPLGQPYVVTLAAGQSPIAYRITSRTPVEPGVRYFLCPDRPEICAEASG